MARLKVQVSFFIDLPDAALPEDGQVECEITDPDVILFMAKTLDLFPPDEMDDPPESSAA